jgi:hypothetical protein
MRRTLIFAAALAVLRAPALLAQAPDTTAALGDAEVQEAIRYGQAHRNTVVGLTLGAYSTGFMNGRCPPGPILATRAECQYGILVQSPFARIATAAAAAAGRYRPFPADSVNAEMRSRLISVTITPIAPYLGETQWVVIPSADHVVLQGYAQRRADPNDVIQPLRVDKVPVRWSNGQGGNFDGFTAVAWFPETVIPNADFDIVIITGGPEARSKVHPGDMRQVTRAH